ncbi:MAG: 2Fe-2S iron-sulfur cluster-binding protein [Acetobacteraceae bacterium]|nr:2Fe-2S iron-sulfur cluster-binding protein [Acetobacteraceae bacterium]
MPQVVFHKAGEVYGEEVADDTNLVVLAGIRRFPYPYLAYGCGMGKCGKCACRIITGAEHLPPPNWKETKRLGGAIDDGYRLVCQLWIKDDIELVQDRAIAPPAPTAAAKEA